MKIERLSQDKIRIFLTFDDLTDRGIQKDDMWREIPKVHELFSDMMEQAYSELGFDATGPLAVEVFAIPAQGMVVIVTRGKMDEHFANGDTLYEDDDDEPDVFEMEVTLGDTDLITYEFTDIEHVISAAKTLQPASIDGGTLYSYNEKYYLFFTPEHLDEAKVQTLVSVLAEYGDVTSMTEEMLEEYGKCIVRNLALEVLCTHF